MMTESEQLYRQAHALHYHHADIDGARQLYAQLVRGFRGTREAREAAKQLRVLPFDELWKQALQFLSDNRADDATTVLQQLVEKLEEYDDDWQRLAVTRSVLEAIVSLQKLPLEERLKRSFRCLRCRASTAEVSAGVISGQALYRGANATDVVTIACKKCGRMEFYDKRLLGDGRHLTVGLDIIARWRAQWQQSR